MEVPMMEVPAMEGVSAEVMVELNMQTSMIRV
jgi:hypothetical protein